MFKNRNVRLFSSLLHSKIIQPYSTQPLQQVAQPSLPESEMYFAVLSHSSSTCLTPLNAGLTLTVPQTLMLFAYPMYTFQLLLLLLFAYFVFGMIKHGHPAIFFSFGLSVSLFLPFCSLFIHQFHKYKAKFSAPSFPQYCPQYLFSHSFLKLLLRPGFHSTISPNILGNKQLRFPNNLSCLQFSQCNNDRAPFHFYICYPYLGNKIFSPPVSDFH